MQCPFGESTPRQEGQILLPQNLGKHFVYRTIKKACPAGQAFKPDSNKI
jgi:hypothetical protein